MERLFKPYDKEYMRMAMLKHEETFKQQVCELHRVYQIQNILMKNIGIGSEQMDHMKKIPKSLEIDLERPVGDDIGEASEVELTLGVGLGQNRRKIQIVDQTVYLLLPPARAVGHVVFIKWKVKESN